MLKKISVDQILPGMHLHAFCGAWLEHPFWRTKFILSDPRDIALIRESGIREVWIDAARGVDVAAGVAMEESVALPATPEANGLDEDHSLQPASFGDEVKRAARICAKSKEAVVSMFQEVRMGKAVDADQAQELVEEISRSVMRNPEALVSLARLKTADDYTYMHSVAVCALMIVLARQLGLGDQETREAGMAGLLHDLGKAMMPPEVLNKPGKLTDAEFAIMKDVCLHHHEKMDGSGYPDGLAGEQITLFARMGAVCDVYDAVTSNRPYKNGWDPAESIKRMAEWQGHFDAVVFQAFVKSLGIYPIGSLVRLHSGRLGVVVEQSEKSLLVPKVKIFFSAKSRTYLKPEIVDLSRPGALDRIIGRENAARWGITDLDRYWAGDAAKPA